MRLSIPALLNTIIAAVTVAGVVVVALATGFGSAPGNGEQTFDAPGCQPKAYDGPGRVGHYLLERDCPTPTPVILQHLSHAGGVWHATLDGSRSFDPVGGRLVKYAWSVDGGPQRSGETISLHYVRPGLHAVVLYVTDDSGSTGTLRATMRLP